jgi:hypothetical protein
MVKPSGFLVGEQKKTEEKCLTLLTHWFINEYMNDNKSRYYGVSYGNGNDGVSQLVPAYVVKTNEPYKLARLAMLSEFKPEFVEWAKDRMEIDGEEEYTIYATIYESYDEEKEREKEQEEAEERGEEYEDDGCDSAWLICEVFRFTEDVEEKHESKRLMGHRPKHCFPVYESLEDCFGDEFALTHKDFES